MDLHDSRPGGGHSGPVPVSGAGGVSGGLSDEELLRRCCRNGDAAAFESLVHRYEQELFSYLRRYLGNAEMAEDVFQATFLQVHLKREQFEEGRRFRPWSKAKARDEWRIRRDPQRSKRMPGNLRKERPRHRASVITASRGLVDHYGDHHPRIGDRRKADK